MSPLNTQKENVACHDYCINKYMHTTSQDVLDLYESEAEIHFCPAKVLPQMKRMSARGVI